MPEREEIKPEKRKRLSKKDKERLLKLKPRCAICKEIIREGQLIEWDHRVPLELGGKQDDDNWEPLHRDCHKKLKTKSDVQAISKARRIRKNLAGLSRPKKTIPSRPFAKRIPKDKS